MITVTKTVYMCAEKDEMGYDYGLGNIDFVKTFQFLKVDTLLHLFATLGFEQEELFTYSEWGRYVLTRFRPETGLEEITIEEEE